MKLSELMIGIATAEEWGNLHTEHITCDSRAVLRGDVFVCVQGGRFDGHEHAAEALDKGAVAVVCERNLGLGAQILVPNTRIAYARMCANFYGNPQCALKLVAVTGTSGKTTVSYLIRDILRAAGKKTGLIGTIQGEIGEMIISARHTTPDPAQLYAMLARMKAAGLEYVVMEASSHALDQRRVEGLHFECAVFTNLSREHLDYHHTMEAYYLAKRRLFDQTDSAVVHLGDAYGKRLAQELVSAEVAVRTVCVQEELKADYTGSAVAFSASGSTFALTHCAQCEQAWVCMPGMYAVENALCALACAHMLGIPLSDAVRGLAKSVGVSGRMEVIEADVPFTVIRDYAHAPDELENVLQTVRSFAKGRIVTLFGCPGERDRGKRADMARAAARYSDFVILTSDNPRSEDPAQIAADALKGLRASGDQASLPPFEVLLDRYDAIRFALNCACVGDILLLLGKGHEDYQVLEYGTIFFDERFIVQDLVRQMHEADSI